VFAEACILLGGNRRSEAKHCLRIYFANCIAVFPEGRSSMFLRSTGNKTGDRKIP